MTPPGSDSPPPTAMALSGATAEAKPEKPGVSFSPSDSISPESVWTSTNALGWIPWPSALAAAL